MFIIADGNSGTETDGALERTADRNAADPRFDFLNWSVRRCVLVKFT